METTGCIFDPFYEDRYKQLKNNLFIGDDTHMGGIGLADMQLERLFDESLKAENVLCRIGQKYDQQKEIIKQGGLFPLKITENTTFSKSHYLLVDNDNKLRIGEWNKKKYYRSEQAEKTGMTVGNYRYYLVPEDMREKVLEEMPETWGLLVWGKSKISRIKTSSYFEANKDWDMFTICSILGREVGLHKVFNYREKK